MTATWPEKLFALGVVLLSTGGIAPLFPGESSLGGDSRLQLIWLLVYAVTLVLLIRRRPTTGGSWPVWLLVVLALSSTFWSEAPDLTARRSAALIGTTMFGVYLATGFSIEELWWILVSGTGVIGAISVLLVIFVPSVGIASDGAWRGVFFTKNELGRLMALGALVWAINVRMTSKKLVSVVISFVCLAIVLQSKSASGVVVLSGLATVGVLVMTIRRQPQWLAYSLIAFASALLLGLLLWVRVNYMEILDVLDRSVTLTGRTNLWSLVWAAIKAKPWFGYGYDAFWLGRAGPSSAIWSVLNWEPPHAHNGFLDLLLNVGFLGLGLFLLSFVQNVGRGIAWAKGNGAKYALPFLFVLSFLLVYNISESVILVRNSIYWILYVLITMEFALNAQGRREHRWVFANWQS